MQTNLSEILSLADMINKGRKRDYEPRWRRGGRFTAENLVEMIKDRKEEAKLLEELYKKKDDDKKGKTGLSLSEAATLTTMLSIVFGQFFIWAQLLLHH